MIPMEIKSVANYLHQETTSTNNDITKSRDNVITETVKKVSPAVVGINVTRNKTIPGSCKSFL